MPLVIRLDSRLALAALIALAAPPLALGTGARGVFADEPGAPRPKIEEGSTGAESPPPVAGGGAAMPGTERKGIKYAGWPIGTYNSSQGVKLGLIGQRFDYGDGRNQPFDSLWTAQFSYATQAETGIFVEHERTHVTGLDLRWLSEAWGYVNPSQRYYGLGDSSTLDPSLEAHGFNFYTQDHLELVNLFRKEIADRLELIGGIAASVDRVASNGNDTLFFQDFSASAEPIAGQLKAQLGIVMERRDSEFIPERGYYFSDMLTAAPSWLGTTGTGWWREDADVRWLLPIIPGRWLGTAWEARYSYSPDSTPIYEKTRLGSQATMRGLRYNRYLANHVASLRGELRTLPVRWRVFDMPLKGGMGVFADTGKVGDTLQRLLDTPVRAAWGFTFFGSYFTDDFVGHSDIAFSPEGAQVYVSLGYAF